MKNQSEFFSFEGKSKWA